MSPARKSGKGPRKGPVDLNTATAVIFVVTMIAISMLAIQIRFLELQQGPSGSGHGHGGSGNGNGTGQGKGAGEATTPSGGGDGASGVNDSALKLGYGPSGGGNARMVTPETGTGTTDKPTSTPMDRGDGAAGDAEGRGVDLSRPTHTSGGVHMGTNTSSGGGGGGGGNGIQMPQINLPEKVKWLIVLVVVLAIGSAVTYLARAYMISRRDALRKSAKDKVKRPVPAAVASAVAEDIIDTLDMTYDSLSKMGDVRRAIALCYARMCRAVAERGLTRSTDITPREFHAVVKATFGVEGKSMKAMTRLFEEAVYSVHPMGEAHREQALGLLKETEKEVRSWQT